MIFILAHFLSSNMEMIIVSEFVVIMECASLGGYFGRDDSVEGFREWTQEQDPFLATPPT